MVNFRSVSADVSPVLYLYSQQCAENKEREGKKYCANMTKYRYR